MSEDGIEVRLRSYATIVASPGVGILPSRALQAFVPYEPTLAVLSPETPWEATGHGGLVSLDGAPWYEPKVEDVKRIVVSGGSFTVSCVVELHPGEGRPQFVSWESSCSDPTGSGFHPDAYGGDAEIWCANTFEVAYRQISEREREAMTFTTRPEEQALCEVLFDMFHQHSPFEAMVAAAVESGEFGEIAGHRVRELTERWKEGRA